MLIKKYLFLLEFFTLALLILAVTVLFKKPVLVGDVVMSCSFFFAMTLLVLYSSYQMRDALKKLHATNRLSRSQQREIKSTLMTKGRFFRFLLAFVILAVCVFGLQWFLDFKGTLMARIVVALSMFYLLVIAQHWRLLQLFYDARNRAREECLKAQWRQAFRARLQKS